MGVQEIELKILKGEKRMYDYSELLGKIKAKCGTQMNFAEKMHLSERSVSLKLNNKVDFSQTEIQRAAEILGIENDEIQTYFFTQAVQEVEPK